MRGDFTRGHQPDQKRGRNYRRVLLQQGRLLLDSDFNALVDAHDELLRDLSRDTSCRAGSPDLGYLVTAGQLLAVFDELDGIETSGINLEIYRDYRHKYLDRYPSLYLGNSSAVAATLQIPLRASSAGEIDLWLRSDGGSVVAVSGTEINVTTSTFAPHTINPPATNSLDITLESGQEVWLGLVERHQEAGTLPTFWSAAGRFHVDGLMVDIPQDGPYSDLHFDPAEGFQIPDLEVDDGGLRPLAVGDRVLAYLEAFERHITHVDDRGILEEALGGSDDTCTRSQAMCQIKVAAAYGLRPEALRQAVRSPRLLDGTLEVTTVGATADPDPCALPVAGGYRGTDNRFYRFEVHRGGPLASSLFKWSRDNGSELFRVRDVTVAGPIITQLIFDAECPLESGDLVEVLDEPHELGDQAFAVLDEAATTFTAPERAVGRLVRLHAAAGPVDGKAFDLSEPDDDAVAVTLTDFGAPPEPMPKVRRWHGLIEPSGGDPFQAEIEDGIEIEVTGSFRAGDWWQYEARARRGNDNGPFQTSPHGPERLFAPLGLFEYQGEDRPLELVSWLDERFPRLCGICADDVCFDGDRVGAGDCDTVQEALEKLFERDSGGGCCERTLTPEPAGDDAQRINDLLAEEVGDLTICLRPGIYQLESAVEVSGRCLTLLGCPEAVLVADGIAPFRVSNGGRLRLGKLALFTPRDVEAPVLELITLEDSADGFEASEVALIMAGPIAGQAAIRAQGAVPLPFDPADPAYTVGSASSFPVSEYPEVSLTDVVVIAGWAVVADALQNVEIRSSAFYLTEGGLSSAQIFGAKIFDNSWVAGVSADLTASWTPAELADEPKRLLDDLADAVGSLSGLLSPPGGLVGLVTQAMVLGTVERNVIVATIGAVVHRFVLCQWEDNIFQAGSYGIDSVRATNTSLTRELIDLQSGLVGIQIFGGSRVTVRDCLIWHAAVALRFAGDEQVILGDGGFVEFIPRPPVPGVPPYANLQEVLAAGNRLDGQIGLQLGAAGVNGFFGQVEEVAVRQNQVDARIGFLLRGPLGVFAAPNQVLVDNNDLRCTEIGIDLAGAGIALTANSLSMSGGAPQAGIRAFQAPRLLIAGSSISGNLGARSFGIWCQFSEQCRIQDNHVSIDEGGTGLGLINCSQTRIVDNDFGLQVVEVSDSSSPLLQGNRGGQIQINQCVGGVVRGNSVNSELSVLRARGQWQIENNRAGGTIVLEPSGVDGPDIDGNVNDGYVIATDLSATQRDEWVMAAIAILAAEQQGTSGDALPANRRLVGVVPGSESRAVMSFAGANPKWRDNWAMALIAEVDGFLVDEVGGFEDGAVVINAFFEDEYQAQVVGNWASTIRIGYRSTSGGVVEGHESVIQVVGNRAESLLEVRPYPHALVANNAAGALSPWISRTTLVNSPNIQF